MSKLIFFVDDDKMIINLLEYTFHGRPQYDFKSFISGEDCLEAMTAHPDLIVLDHQLSSAGEFKMNGIETLEKIREMNPEIPVIVLTAHGSDELHRRFTEAGAVRFLTKDHFFVDALMESIGEVLK